jgi:peroxiredoxin
MRYKMLSRRDAAPQFVQRSTSDLRFSLHSLVGRYIVLCFFVTASDIVGRDALLAIARNRGVFDDVTCSFLGVSLDPEDEWKRRVRGELPGIRHVWDFDGTVCRRFGAIPLASMPGDGDFWARRFWLLLDPALRVLALVPFAGNGSEQSEVFATLQAFVVQQTVQPRG